jgi:hypothetical protein
MGWSVAQAGTIQWSVTLDQVTVNQGGQANDFSSSTGFPTFTGDFSVDKQLRLTFSAPAGQQFVFSRPSGATSWQLFADIWDDPIISLITFTPGVSYSFANLQGSAIVTPSFFDFTNDPDSFRARLYGPLVSDTVSFTSLTMLFDVPAGFNETYTDYTLARVFFRGWAADNASTTPFAGFADAVPEPATLLLLGTGLAAAGMRRRMKKRT